MSGAYQIIKKAERLMSNSQDCWVETGFSGVPDTTNPEWLALFDKYYQLNGLASMGLSRELLDAKFPDALTLIKLLVETK